MKRILITGENSYIGTSFQEYLRQFPDEYEVEMLSVRGDGWKKKDFSAVDRIVHTAAIVHRKETRKNAALYYKVNRDLTLELAKKAKEENVKQFVFLSTASVYGVNEGIITHQTIPDPVSHYGKSKLQAENGLRKMQTESFIVSILRSPMVYGEGCKGNYQTLLKIAKWLPIFAKYQNERSAIHIERLCEFIRSIVDEQRGGIFFPQDSEYFCTCRMIQKIGLESGKKIRLVKALNPFIWVIKKTTPQGKKAFGDLIYKGQHPMYEPEVSVKKRG